MTSLLDERSEQLDFSDPMTMARFAGDFDSLLAQLEEDIAQLRIAVKPVLKHHRKLYGKP
jgi:hypothetical protein